MAAPSGRRRGVVTGAGSGIGKAVVHRLLREGVDVLAVDIHGSNLAGLKGGHCETLAADLTDPAVRAEVADWADGYRPCWEKSFQRLDVLLAEMKKKAAAHPQTTRRGGESASGKKKHETKRHIQS